MKTIPVLSKFFSDIFETINNTIEDKIKNNKYKIGIE